MWCQGLLSLSAPLPFRLGLAAIVRGGRKVEHPLVVFLFSNSTVPQLDSAVLPLQKKILKQMIVKLYSRVCLLFEGIIGNGYYRKVVGVTFFGFYFEIEKQMQK